MWHIQIVNINSDKDERLQRGISPKHIRSRTTSNHIQQIKQFKSSIIA